MRSMVETLKVDRKAVFGWILFDFANSAYTTLIVTFIYGTFFVKAIAPDEITGTTLWSRAITVTAITIALLSPILGALADRWGMRKLFLYISTAVTIFGSIVLFFVLPGQIMPALVWFVISNIAFEFCNVFYNAYLPDVAPPPKIGLISGLGWGVGYFGGILAMFLAMTAFINPEVPWFGFSKLDGENIRATNLLVAAWFLLFSIPMFVFVKSKPAAPAKATQKVLKKAFADIISTFREVKKYRETAKFLLARMVYNDGLVTIIAFGGIYAAGTFGMSFQEIMTMAVVIYITTGISSIVVGYFEDALGGKRTIMISNILLTCATLLFIFSQVKSLFWVAVVLVGIAAGPNQSASRSMLGRFIPEGKRTQFYGFFAFSGKLTAFIGPLLMGILTDIFKTQRAGAVSIIVFFIAGSLLLAFVNEKAGIEAATDGETRVAESI